MKFLELLEQSQFPVFIANRQNLKSGYGVTEKRKKKRNIYSR